MNFSTEHWASHKRGKNKRAEISLYLSQNPNATPQEIADAVNLSIWQVKRHLSKIRLERGMNSVAIASAFAICSVSLFSQWSICSPHSAAQSRKKDSSFVLLFSPQVYC